MHLSHSLAKPQDHPPPIDIEKLTLAERAALAEASWRVSGASRRTPISLAVSKSCKPIRALTVGYSLLKSQ
jgi:hypothetical protein